MHKSQALFPSKLKDVSAIKGGFFFFNCFILSSVKCFEFIFFKLRD